MIDLDDFKLYNDIYGHDMGDQVLCIVADVIKNCIRKIDKLIRYGGDEFLLILSDMRIDNVLHYKLEGRVHKKNNECNEQGSS